MEEGNSFKITASEMDLIKKYRTLDARDKENISDMLAWCCDRMRNEAETRRQELKLNKELHP